MMVNVPTPIPITKLLGVKSASVGARVGIAVGNGVEAMGEGLDSNKNLKKKEKKLLDFSISKSCKLL